MSIKIMSKIWDCPEPKGAAERLVLLALADNANDEGICWPSLTYIAKKCVISTRYVIKIIHSLEDAGFLTKQHRYNNSNTYRIIINRLKINSDPASEPQFTPPVNYSSPASEPQFTPVVNYSSLKPSFNHQEPSIITTPPASDKFFDETTREGSARTRVVNALDRGLNHDHEICDAVRIHLGLDITRNSKVNKEFRQFLKEVPEEQTIAGFALYWKSTWPGNLGQPPTLNQIRERWPSAFPSEVDTEQRRMERFEAQLLKGVR